MSSQPIVMLERDKIVRENVPRNSSGYEVNELEKSDSLRLAKARLKKQPRYEHDINWRQIDLNSMDSRNIRSTVKVIKNSNCDSTFRERIEMTGDCVYLKNSAIRL